MVEFAFVPFNGNWNSSESVEGEILKTDSTRPSVPPGHPRVANRDNLRRGVPIGTTDVEYYLYTDSSTQGWGAHLQD